MASKKKKKISAVAAAIIAATVALEGGWVNNKNDPGGETNKGITKQVAVEHGYTGPMRTIPDDVVTSIYYDSYLVKPGFEPLIDIDAPVAEELFDTAVNMGPTRPSRWFQQSINIMCDTNIAEDGRVGPTTIRAYAECQRRVGREAMCRVMLSALDNQQLLEYDRLTRVNAKLKVFHRGWVAHRIKNVDREKCA